MSEKLSQRIESLFHEALERSEDQREEFLVAACAGNTTLYNEVKSLLQHYSVHQQFFEEMAVPRLVLDSPAPAFGTGAVVGNYEIVRLLGKGGMGEVYLARDLKLGRKVAVKILPRTFSGSPDLIERLHREAKAASALNHPNILTIHDFGEQGDIHYMVMELVEGTQLRELIGRLSVAQALDYARQIGQALQAAHQVGIVHRDIKPENVMVREDGYVKVVDFGLAKLANPSLATGPSLAARLSSGVVSLPGLLVGTINYMSPEQARGQQVDRRTDIWSWGVVFYEMLAGRRPFDAPTSSDVLAAILSKTPDPPTNDENLNRIVRKALAKEIHERYLSMAEALEELAGIPVPTINIARPSRISGTQRPFSVSRLLGRKARWVWLSAALLLVAVAGAAVYRLRQVGLDRPLQWGGGTTQITNNGRVTCHAISPDGNYLVYAAREGLGQSLKLLQIGAHSGPTLLSAGPGEYRGITFSKDGLYIYYVLWESEMGTLYSIPLTGSPNPQVVAKDVDSRISFSPDGERYVFQRLDQEKRVARLIIRRLDKQGSEEILDTVNILDACLTPPMWSPDRERILCGIRSSDPPAGFKILSVSLTGGKREVWAPKVWSWESQLTWLKQGRSIALAAADLGSTTGQPVELSWPGGIATPIIRDQYDYSDLDSTADSRTLAARQMTRISEIWITPTNGAPSYPLKDVGNRMYGVTWLDSKSLISQAEINGRHDLWIVQLAGGMPVQLTDDTHIKKHPSVSPDGRHMVYTADRDGMFHVWISDVAGKDMPVRLTRDKAIEDDAVFTPDGRSVVYRSIRDGNYALLEAPTDGGEPRRIAPTMHARKPAVSPNGEQIAFEFEGPNGWTIAVTDDKGENPRFFPNIPVTDTAPPVRWSADGHELLYVMSKNDADNVWAQPLNGRPPRQVTRFKQEHIFAFALSPDSRNLACARGTAMTDVVLFQSSK